MTHKARWILVCALVTAGSLAAQGQECVCVRDLVLPDYSPLAWTARLQGKVVLDIQILANGHVQHVTASGGPRLLQQEASSNIRQWTFCGFPRTTKFPLHHRIVYLYKLQEEPWSENRPTYIFRLPDYVEIVTHPPAQLG